MAVPKFTVTYDIVTEESAEYGDAEERGFVLPGGWHQPDVNDPHVSMSLREAVNLVGCVENSGSWFTETDERFDYETGGRETRSLHPPRNVTPSSYRRLCRLLGARP